MKMKIWQFVIIALSFVIITVLVTGCSSTSGYDNVAGKYVGVNEPTLYIELHPDGTFSSGNDYVRIDGTYTVSGNTIRSCYTEEFLKGGGSEKIPAGSCDSKTTISGNQLIVQHETYYTYYKKV